MKKVLFTAVAVLGFTFANAQDETTSNGGFAKGDLFVSGTVGFNSSKTGDFKTNDLTFSPAVGYFLTENIAAGVRLNVTSGTEDNGVTKDKTSSFGAQVFGRYYTTPASQFSLFGELAVGMNSYKVSPDGFDSSTYKSFGVNAGFGVNYFLSSNWAMEAGWAGLGYTSYDNGGNGADKTNSFGLNVDLSAINFGLIYKF
jgi:opacity protein-like surface antigen